MMKCAVFASGGGSNFQSLLNRKNAGDLHVEFTLFIGNNSKAAAFDRARNYGITAIHCAPSHFADEYTYAEHLLALLNEHGVELIILAGYMKKMPVSVVTAFKNRIINIHPALLPAFGGPGLYGEKVHQAVLGYGAKVSGITVHFVDEEYDHGPVILQDTVPVLDSDDAHSLARRVLILEHASYWKAVEAIAQNRITVKGRNVYGRV
jgi:phosphoribosylglycinamide formyltransferase-1